MRAVTIEFNDYANEESMLHVLLVSLSLGLFFFSPSRAWFPTLLSRLSSIPFASRPLCLIALITARRGPLFIFPSSYMRPTKKPTDKTILNSRSAFAQIGKR